MCLRVRVRVRVCGQLAKEADYPESLLQVQPRLVQMDHARQVVGELAAGTAGIVSRRSVAEAIDAVQSSALTQHTFLIEMHRSAHAALLDTLKAQQDAAAAALEEYVSVTSKAEAHFQQSLSEAKRGAKSDAIDRVLSVRDELLLSEKLSQERYRKRVAATTTAVMEALRRITEREPGAKSPIAAIQLPAEPPPGENGGRGGAGAARPRAPWQ